MKKLALALATLVFLAPSLGMLSIGVLFSTANLACAPADALSVGEIPSSLTATTRNGERMTLGRTQLTHAATIITVGARTDGVGRAGVVIALMAALTESRLRMLANSSAYPSSTSYPHDGDGRDHDSLGLFQMRPVSGWGSVAELMDPAYQARAFFGGPTGPNYPSPRGLLDIPRWRNLAPGAAAQAVEVSAYPDRYANFQPVAEAILTNLAGGSTGAWGDPVNGADASLLSWAGCPGTEVLPPGPDGVCPPSGSSAERGLEPNALRALRCVKQRFPWIKYMGGVGRRPGGYVSDHPAGRAVDFMIPAWNTKAGKDRGWEVAHWLQAHAEELHVKYLIFDDRSWRAYNPSAGWRPYRYPGPNPSGASQRHLNHVHLSVYSG